VQMSDDVFAATGRYSAIKGSAGSAP